MNKARQLRGFALTGLAMVVATLAVSPASAGPADTVAASPQVRAEQQFRAELGFPSQLGYVQSLQRVKNAARIRLQFGAVFTPAEQRELMVRKQLADDAGRLDGLLRRVQATNYGGMYIDQRAGGLLKIAFVHPDLRARAFALARVHAPQRVRFWKAGMTARQLTALSAAITASMGDLRGRGVVITGVGADYAANVVDVGVDAEGSALGRASSVLHARFGNKGLFIHFQRPSREASCLGCDTDPLPFKGGQELDDETSGSICTAGYGSHTFLPETWFQLTAGHCSVNGDLWAHFIYVVGTTSGSMESGSADAQRIQLSAQSQHSSQIFVNGTYVQVSGLTTSFTQGGTVCFFGRTTGFEKCGQITRTSYSDYACGGVRGCTTVTDTVTASYLYLGGDSGGPNFQQASPTVAYGMSRSACDQACAGAGNPTFSVFTKIANELNAEGLSLNTTTNP